MMSKEIREGVPGKGTAYAKTHGRLVIGKSEGLKKTCVAKTTMGAGGQQRAQSQEAGEAGRPGSFLEAIGCADGGSASESGSGPSQPQWE